MERLSRAQIKGIKWKTDRCDALFISSQQTNITCATVIYLMRCLATLAACKTVSPKGENKNLKCLFCHRSGEDGGWVVAGPAWLRGVAELTCPLYASMYLFKLAFLASHMQEVHAMCLCVLFLVARKPACPFHCASSGPSLASFSLFPRDLHTTCPSLQHCIKHTLEFF